MTVVPPSLRSRRPRAIVAVVLSLALIACRAPPDPPILAQPDSIERGVAADRQQPAAHDADLLLIGTSTISLWNTECSFPGREVVKRGLSGAMIADIDRKLDDLFGQVSPRQILLYAGENDIARGDDAEQVRRALLALIDRVRANFPRSELLVMAIKPSPARMAVWPRAVAVNAALQAAAAQRGYCLIEMASPLM
ncbi:MAG: hypothetical protein H5U21_03075, partial [Porphyrobacter sp.]|nr:hypothetical protein [Porphyrobacter sp.]